MRFLTSLSALLISALLILGASARAGDPPKDKEFVPPAPRIIVTPPPGNLFLPPAYAHGTRDVWQNYAVDNTGRWRPRVILAPFGSYYYYNGQPFPWTTTHNRSFRPVTQD